MRFHGLMSLAFTAVASIATGRASAENMQPATAPPNDQGMEMGACPMRVPGTIVMAADVEGGIALSFTTSTGNVANLRQNVRRMAEMHDQMHSQGGMAMSHPHGTRAPPGDHQHHGRVVPGNGGMSGGMPDAITTVEDIPGGAQFILRPRDPARLEALRAYVRTQAAQMGQGQCPLMGGCGCE